MRARTREPLGETAPESLPTWQPRAHRPTHILFPYRPSRRGDRALSAAAELAEENGAELTVLVPVINQEKGARRCGLQGVHWMNMLQAAAADDLERARRLLSDRAAATFAIAEGEAFHQVVKQFARDHGCDLTVMAPLCSVRWLDTVRNGRAMPGTCPSRP